jgi:predicted PurR-regulated permease PerM
MAPSNSQKNNVYFYWALVISLLVLAALIIKDYIIALVSAFILAYLMKPLYRYFSRVFPSWCSALLCIGIVVLLILLPLGVVATVLIQQASESLVDADVGRVLAETSQHPLLKQWNIDVAALREKTLGFFISAIVKMFRAIPSFLLSLLVLGFSMFYMLTHWDSLSRALIRYIPFKDKARIAAEIDTTTQRIVHGTILMALLEWLVAALGFWLSGVPSYLLLATIIFFFAFIPGIGPAVVWIPTTFFYFWNNNYPAAIGVIITGLAISVGIEVMLRAKLLGSSSGIHPLIMLLGIVGGVSVFGIFGFIIGPLILAYALKLLDEGLRNTSSYKDK